MEKLSKTKRMNVFLDMGLKIENVIRSGKIVLGIYENQQRDYEYIRRCYLRMLAIVINPMMMARFRESKK
jgi:hypothetical protein